MATLNQIVDQLADALNRPFDTLLKERLKLLVIQERAKVIRQAINKGDRNVYFKQQYGVKMKLVDSLDSIFSSGDFAIRSENKIPKPLRYRTGAPFIYVGSMNGRNSYVYCGLSERSYIGTLPNNANTPRYNYRNGYLYIFTKILNQQAKTITAFSDYGDDVSGTVKVTSNWHELSTGDTIVITGTTNYNGTFSVTKIDSNNFYISDTWVEDDATGSFVEYDIDDFGLQGSITEVTDYSATVSGTINITSTKHGLVSRDIITIEDTTSYNGDYKVTKIDDDNFYITKAYVADETGKFFKSYVSIEAIYENPELIIPTETADNYSAGIIYNYDMDFPITLDLIQDIKDRLLSGELSITDNKDKITATHLDNE